MFTLFLIITSIFAGEPYGITGHFSEDIVSNNKTYHSSTLTFNSGNVSMCGSFSNYSSLYSEKPMGYFLMFYSKEQGYYSMYNFDHIPNEKDKGKASYKYDNMYRSISCVNCTFTQVNSTFFIISNNSLKPLRGFPTEFNWNFNYQKSDEEGENVVAAAQPQMFIRYVDGDGKSDKIFPISSVDKKSFLEESRVEYYPIIAPDNWL